MRGLSEEGGLLCKLGGRGSIPRTHVKVEGEHQLHKVSCDLNMCAVTRVLTPPSDTHILHPNKNFFKKSSGSP